MVDTTVSRISPTSPEEASSTGNGRARAGHWFAPDVLGDILAIAQRVGAAEPVEIRVRPEILHRLARQTGNGTGSDGEGITDLGGIPLVVDHDLPTFPGYEIHRAPPRSSRAQASGCPPAGARAA